jgi:phosphoserine phosphatase
VRLVQDHGEYLLRAYQDQQAAGFMTLELGSKLEGLEATRRSVRAELAALEARKERVSELKRDRGALLESWAGNGTGSFGEPYRRRAKQLYRMLRLEVTPASNGYRVTGALSGFLHSETDG